MYISSRAEGEAIVPITNDPRTTNTPHGKKERTTRGRSQPSGGRRSAATEPPSEARGLLPPSPAATLYACGVAAGAEGSSPRGRRGNEGARRPTEPREGGAQTSPLPAAIVRAEGRRRAPPNEEGRKAREPRDPEGVAAGARAATFCPRKGDKLTFVNLMLSTCKTTTYIYLGMEI